MEKSRIFEPPRKAMPANNGISAMPFFPPN